jgi:hypothetical protein
MKAARPVRALNGVPYLKTRSDGIAQHVRKEEGRKHGKYGSVRNI